jgi:glutaredoxin-like protein NrdH
LFTQPACNPNPTLRAKRRWLQCLLVVVYRGFLSTTTKEKNKEFKQSPHLNSYIRRKLNFIGETFMQFSNVSGKKNDHKVTLYALSTCVWCKMTKQYLNDNSVEYEFVDVDLLDDKERSQVHEIIRSKGGELAYPTTIVDDKTVINGFRKDKLKEVLKL